jgi:hypothetical protein
VPDFEVNDTAGINMRLISFVVIIFMSTSAVPATEPAKYTWLFLKTDSRTWCGYSSERAFLSATGTSVPAESAKIAYKGELIAELSYQFQPESGDWIVLDKYIEKDDRLILWRTVLPTQENIKVIQSSVIPRKGRVKFSIVAMSKLDGEKMRRVNMDYPLVPVRRAYSDFPFMGLLNAMRRNRLPELCK